MVPLQAKFVVVPAVAIMVIVVALFSLILLGLLVITFGRGGQTKAIRFGSD